jgi:hypothetical protein
MSSILPRENELVLSMIVDNEQVFDSVISSCSDPIELAELGKNITRVGLLKLDGKGSDDYHRFYERASGCCSKARRLIDGFGGSDCLVELGGKFEDRGDMQRSLEDATLFYTWAVELYERARAKGRDAGAYHYAILLAKWKRYSEG